MGRLPGVTDILADHPKEDTGRVKKKMISGENRGVRLQGRSCVTIQYGGELAAEELRLERKAGRQACWAHPGPLCPKSMSEAWGMMG